MSTLGKSFRHSGLGHHRILVDRMVGCAVACLVAAMPAIAQPQPPQIIVSFQDLDGDGVVDALNIVYMLEHVDVLNPTSVQGDLNGDGVADAADLLVMAGDALMQCVSDYMGSVNDTCVGYHLISGPNSNTTIHKALTCCLSASGCSSPFTDGGRDPRVPEHTVPGGWAPGQGFDLLPPCIATE